MVDSQIVDLLNYEATKINSPEFIADDPVQFPRLFSDLRDIEITSLLISAIAWGNRKMILRDSERLLSLMEHQPYNFVMDGAYEELPDELNIHRTFFARNLKYFSRGLKRIYEKYPSIDELSRAEKLHETEEPAWRLAEKLNAMFSEANDGKEDSRCLPLNTTNSALKRLNMALRWLVRNDGIVDLGIWSSLKPSQLYVPLDVHVANVSRGLGLLTRKSNDRKAVIELTQTLKELRPEDPTFYDFALFGIGVTGRKNEVIELPQSI